MIRGTNAYYLMRVRKVKNNETWDVLRTYCVQRGNTYSNSLMVQKIFKHGRQIYTCEQVKQAINETKIQHAHLTHTIKHNNRIPRLTN